MGREQQRIEKEQTFQCSALRYVYSVFSKNLQISGNSHGALKPSTE